MPLPLHALRPFAFNEFVFYSARFQAGFSLVEADPFFMTISALRKVAMEIKCRILLILVLIYETLLLKGE